MANASLSNSCECKVINASLSNSCECKVTNAALSNSCQCKVTECAPRLLAHTSRTHFQSWPGDLIPEELVSSVKMNQGFWSNRGMLFYTLLMGNIAAYNIVDAENFSVGLRRNLYPIIRQYVYCEYYRQGFTQDFDLRGCGRFRKWFDTIRFILNWGPWN